MNSKSAKTLWKEGSVEKRMKILKSVCSNPCLDGATVEFDLKKPYVTLAEMRQKEDWRRRAGEYRTWFIQNPQVNINNIHKLLVA